MVTIVEEYINWLSTTQYSRITKLKNTNTMLWVISNLVLNIRFI